MNVDFLTTQKDGPQLPPAKPALNALERVMLVIVGVTLAAGCFLISSRHHPEAGQRPWRAGSALQPLTQLMSLNFEYPTTRGTEIKWLVQGLGAVAALMVAIIGWYLWTRPQDPEALPAGTRPRRSLRDRFRFFFTKATPTSAAQMALVLFAGWTFLTAYWAPWPAGALGEGLRQLLPILWAVVLARTLSARGARRAALLLVGILALTSAIGIWYYYERNPGQRLKFPIGNPIFLAACLLPGLMLPLAWLAGWVEGSVRRGLAGSENRRHGGQPLQEGGNLQAQAAPASHVPLWIAIGSAVCFAMAAWAFRLAGSRGPLLGLGLGLIVLLGMAVPKRARWLLTILTLAGLVYTGFYASGRLDQEGSRWATIRFRTYAWKYAVQRFVVRPVTGAGQGSYLLGAQSMSLEDAERDPAAFPGELLGHAHNEWLEILSDVGAAGFALISTALGITFWGALLASRRLGSVFNRWCLLGLAGALAALIFEEMTDVALRTPVLPLIFYTVVGLIWALSASTERHPEEAIEPGHGRGVRVSGLLLGGLACAAMAWMVISDWQGARAQFRIDERVEKKDWEGALAEAADAGRLRLGIEDRLMATNQGCGAAHQAAVFWFGELGEMAGRAQKEHRLSAPAAEVARDNAARFERYFDASRAAGEHVLRRMPYFPHLAGQLSGLWLLKGDEERIEEQLGLRQKSATYQELARQLLALECQRAPFDAELNLRLLELTPDTERLDRRLNLLRVPLRAGRIHPGASRALAVLMQDRDFGAVLGEWMVLAQKTLDSPSGPWSDPYAPETLRLAALVRELQAGSLQGMSAKEASQHAREVLDLAEQSTVMAQGAADLLLNIRARFPTAAAYAWADQARYRLQASPDKPEQAIAVYRQALAEWPAYGPANEGELLQEGLSTYLLALGQEDQARQNLRTIFPGATPQMVDARLALHLEQLAQSFIVLPPQVRPARFADLVARWLELAPRSEAAVSHLMAAQLALEQDQDAAAMSHLEIVRQNSEPEQFGQAVAFLAVRFPQSTAVRLLAQRLSERGAVPAGPASQPDTAPAAQSQPASEPES